MSVFAFYSARDESVSKFKVCRLPSQICDIITGLEPIIVQYTIYTSDMWTFENSTDILSPARILSGGRGVILGICNQVFKLSKDNIKHKL